MGSLNHRYIFLMKLLVTVQMKLNGMARENFLK